MPKVSSRGDLDRLDVKLSAMEQRLGRGVGSTTLLPIVSEVPEERPLDGCAMPCEPIFF